MHPGGDTEPLHFFTSDTGFGQNSHQMPGRALHAKPHSLGVPPHSLGTALSPPRQREGGRGGEGAGRGESDTGPHPLRLPKARPPPLTQWRPK